VWKENRTFLVKEKKVPKQIMGKSVSALKGLSLSHPHFLLMTMDVSGPHSAAPAVGPWCSCRTMGEV